MGAAKSEGREVVKAIVTAAAPGLEGTGYGPAWVVTFVVRLERVGEGNR